MLQIILGLVCALLMAGTAIIARNMIEKVYNKLRNKPLWMSMLSGLGILVVETLVLIAILALMSL